MDRKSKKTREPKLDGEELELERALGRGAFEEDMTRGQAQDEWNKVLANSRRKVPVTVRLPDDVIDKLKVKAIQEGIPYQTLVNSVLHKYVRGKLKEVV